MEFNLDNLNPAQLEAVKCCDAPSLVIAGAGSGKTRVLTTKIAYLLQQGMSPWNILALTFTNKAAKEMRERIGTMVGNQHASMLWMGTFHSIFARILRIESEVVGFTPDFTIYDTSDTQSLLKVIIKEKGLDEKKYAYQMVAKRISEAKNNLMLPIDYIRDADYKRRDAAAHLSQLGAIYASYQDRLQQSNAMDFDDLLLYTWLLLSDHEEIRKKYEERFRYVLVDEYQDTNYAQHQIVWLLTQTRQMVCVVGDDAQSIYSFRGARIDNILKFQSLYSGAKLFKLEQNYRSTQIIVQAANSLIDHNKNQIHKDVFSTNDGGENIEVLEAYSDKEEACIVARKIMECKRRNSYANNEFAILYRTNSQSRVIEEELRRVGLKYMVYSGMSFYQRAEIKSAISYMRLCLNPNDEEALRRVINYPARGIGQTTIDKLSLASLENGVPMWTVLCSPIEYQVQLNAGTLKRLSEFVALIERHRAMAMEQSADEVAQSIVTLSGLMDEFKNSRDPKDDEKRQNLQELIDGIATYVDDATEEGRGVSLKDYIQEVALVSELDKDDDGSPAVSLMTIHAAKGLEFKVVFVVGMEQELFPSSTSAEIDIEEERRLCYVAMTRAKERLFLSWSHSRFRYGHYENNHRSQFIGEINPVYLGKKAKTGVNLLGERKPIVEQSFERPVQRHMYSSVERPMQNPYPTRPTATMRPIRQVTSSFTAATPASAEAQKLHAGSRILHQRFGKGVVQSVDGTGLDTKATVMFEAVGTKLLLLRFAKFDILD